MSVRLSVCPSVPLFVPLFLCLSVCPSVCKRSYDTLSSLCALFLCLMRTPKDWQWSSSKLGWPSFVEVWAKLQGREPNVRTTSYIWHENSISQAIMIFILLFVSYILGLYQKCRLSFKPGASYIGGRLDNACKSAQVHIRPGLSCSMHAELNHQQS